MYESVCSNVLVRRLLRRIPHPGRYGDVTAWKIWWRHAMEAFSASLALCEGNPPVTGGFPSKRASSAECVSLSWRHRVSTEYWLITCTTSLNISYDLHTSGSTVQTQTNLNTIDKLGDSPQKGPAMLIFEVFFVVVSQQNCWTNSPVAGDLRRHDRWIPLRSGQQCGSLKFSLLLLASRTVEQTILLPVIYDAMALMLRHCSDSTKQFSENPDVLSNIITAIHLSQS